MSEKCPQDPDRTSVQDPEAAGFPAANPAVAPPEPPREGPRAHDVPGARVDEPASGAVAGDPLDDPGPAPRLAGRGRPGQRLRATPSAAPTPLTPPQRLLLLDAWVRSGLPAGDFAPLVGLSRHTLYAWKKRFDELGPAGLTDAPRGGAAGSKLPELTKRTILLLKQSHPDWGCQKISDLLLRGPALPASPSAVARVLREAGYVLEDVPAHPPHAPPVRHFERAAPNQLWQTDLFTFMLKRQNRRVYLVAFLDDHSRFVTGFGLHASQSSALVLEVLRASLDAFGAPQEILTDNGSQYVTWRGTSAFSRELTKRGIRQVVAAPRHPQTLGKIERFWGSLWRECLEAAVFLDLADARRRLGHYVDHYNFQRPHQGIDGLVPADRFFGAAAEVRRALEARVQGNALELAREGLPRPPFYVAGQVGGQGFSLHAEGERVILTDATGQRQEVELGRPAAAPPTPFPEPVGPAVIVSGETPLDPEAAPPAAPGASPLDAELTRLRAAGVRAEQGGGA
jgi:transposase InsO family protein